jgi:hypothetical protein
MTEEQKTLTPEEKVEMLEKLVVKMMRRADAHTQILENHGAALIALSDGVATIAEKIGLTVVRPKNRLDS